MITHSDIDKAREEYLKKGKKITVLPPQDEIRKQVVRSLFGEGLVQIFDSPQVGKHRQMNAPTWEDIEGGLGEEMAIRTLDDLEFAVA